MNLLAERVDEFVAKFRLPFIIDLTNASGIL